MADIRERAKFDFIRYANCWEDADILRDALCVRPGDSCLSIASSGDNSLSLLADAPRLVVAFDLNPAAARLPGAPRRGLPRPFP